MSELVFDCTDAGPDPYAVAPTVVFRLRIAETTGQPIGGIALRVQFRIEPLKRRYSDDEAATTPTGPTAPASAATSSSAARWSPT